MPEMLELLLVEDDPAIVSTLSDFLQQEGFSILNSHRISTYTIL